MKTSGTICTRLGGVGGGGGGGSGGALYGCSGRDDRVVKPHHRLENGEEEMQVCFARLMQLVPTVPSTGRMTKVQLLQHVIDYILDLETTLDFRPSESSLRSAASAVAAKDTDDVTDRGLTSGFVVGSLAADRRPLSENAPQVNNISPDVALQQALSLLPTVSSTSSSSSARQPTTWP